MKEGKISSRSEVLGARQKKHFNFLRTKEIKKSNQEFYQSAKSCRLPGVSKERRQMDSHTGMRMSSAVQTKFGQ